MMSIFSIHVDFQPNNIGFLLIKIKRQMGKHCQVLLIAICISVISSSTTDVFQETVSDLQEKVIQLTSRIEELQNKKVAPRVIRTKWLKNFKIQENRVACVVKQKWLQVIMNRIIPVSSQYTFYVKILASYGMWIGCGLVDIEKQLQARYSWNTANAFVMHAANGGVSYNDGTGRKFQNVKRFSVGQTIEIKVNTSTGIISWSVDGQLYASITSPALTSTSRTFAPFIEFFNKLDGEHNEIEWWE